MTSVISKTMSSNNDSAVHVHPMAERYRVLHSASLRINDPYAHLVTGWPPQDGSDQDDNFHCPDATTSDLESEKYCGVPLYPPPSYSEFAALTHSRAILGSIPYRSAPYRSAACTEAQQGTKGHVECPSACSTADSTPSHDASHHESETDLSSEGSLSPRKDRPRNGDDVEAPVAPSYAAIAAKLRAGASEPVSVEAPLPTPQPSVTIILELQKTTTTAESRSRPQVNDGDVVDDEHGSKHPLKKRPASGWKVATKGPKAQKVESSTAPKAPKAAKQQRVTAAPPPDDDILMAEPTLAAPQSKPTKPSKSKKAQAKRGDDDDDEQLLRKFAALTALTGESTVVGVLVCRKTPGVCGKIPGQIAEKIERSKSLQSPAAKILMLQSVIFSCQRNPGLEQQLAWALKDSAEAHIGMYDFENARIQSERAVQLAAKHELQRLKMEAQLALGKACEALVQSDVARSALEDALSIARALGDRSAEADIECHLGTIFELLGLFEESFCRYKRSLELALELGDRRLECEIISNTSVAYLSAGNIDDAERVLMGHLDIALALRDTSIATKFLTNLAHVKLLQGDVEGAIDLHQQEFQWADRAEDALGRSQALSSIGAMYKIQGKLCKALETFENELSVCENCLQFPSRKTECLMNIGHVLLLMGRCEKARVTHGKALAVASSDKKNPDIVSVAKATVGTADVDVCELKFEDALKGYHEALSKVADSVTAAEKARYMIKIGCCEVDWRALDGLEKAFNGQGRHFEALARADRKHLPLLTDLVKSQIPAKRQTGVGMPSYGFLQHNKLRQACAAHNISTVVHYDLFWDDVAEFNVYVFDAASKKTVSRRCPISPEAVATLAAQYSEFRLMVVGDAFDTPLVPHFLAMTAETSVRERLRQGRPWNLATHLRVMHEAFITPIEDLLPSGGSQGHVCFVPDGLLCNIPFHALTNSEGAYLIERFPLFTVPSLELLCDMAVRAQSTHVGHDATGSKVLTLSKKSSSVCDPAIPIIALDDVADPAATLQAAYTADALDCLILELPSVFDLREDYSGSVRLSSTDNNLTMSSETVTTKWAISAATSPTTCRTAIVTGFSGFTYRVVHETSICMTRALLAAGADRVIFLQWAAAPSPVLVQALVTAVANRSLQSNTVARTLQQLMIQWIRTGVDVQDWAVFSLLGLP